MTELLYEAAGNEEGDSCCQIYHDENVKNNHRLLLARVPQQKVLAKDEASKAECHDPDTCCNYVDD